MATQVPLRVQRYTTMVMEANALQQSQVVCLTATVLVQWEEQSITRVMVEHPIQ